MQDISLYLNDQFSINTQDVRHFHFYQAVSASSGPAHGIHQPEFLGTQTPSIVKCY